MEGQATWLMMESAARKSGQSLKKCLRPLLDMANAAPTRIDAVPGVGRRSAVYRAHLYSSRTAEGLRFNHIMMQKEGQAGFARVFTDPPVSSQQSCTRSLPCDTRPVDVAFAEIAGDERDWKTLTSGSLGEFDHSVLLEQYLGRDRCGCDRSSLARWQRRRLSSTKRDKRTVLLYASEWDTRKMRERCSMRTGRC